MIILVFFQTEKDQNVERRGIESSQTEEGNKTDSSDSENEVIKNYHPVYAFTLGDPHNYIAWAMGITS